VAGVFLLSHMRTGSTWLQGILMHFYSGYLTHAMSNQQTANNKRVVQAIRKGHIVKAHFWTHNEVLDALSSRKNLDYKIVSIVRNPMDRLNSLYHYRIRKNKGTRIKELRSISNRVEDRQLERMEDGYSTRNHYRDEKPYIWTTYEWMKKDTNREIKAITEYLGFHPTDAHIRNINNWATRRTKSNGNFRKGKNNDWKNTFSKDEFSFLEEYQREYFKILDYEQHSNSNNDIC
jgi:hypothetical protein